VTFPAQIAFSALSNWHDHGFTARHWQQSLSQQDSATQKARQERAAKGEPKPYIAGELFFRDRSFHCDARAYITDPETSYLIDAVGKLGESWATAHGRPPRVLEFGVGSGILSVSLKLEYPTFEVYGLDVDPPTLELARENVSRHAVDVHLFESDYFSAWPLAEPPDIIFGDPPWGSREDLYANDRSAQYYDFMPARSAYPTGAVTAIHTQILSELQRRQWPSLFLLNCGVLTHAMIRAFSTGMISTTFYHPEPHLTLLAGRAH